jgi:Domain of unknown function DUF29
MRGNAVDYEEDFCLWTEEQERLLRSAAEQILNQVYRIARENAEEETGITKAIFPNACPFRPDEVLSRGFLPEP